MTNRPPTRIKICGITSAEDACAAAAAGADAVGFIFVRSSPRYLPAEAAAGIVRRLPPFVKTVGVFVDASPGEITEIAQAVPLDLVQLHGHEDPLVCNRLARPYVKGVRMRDGVNLTAQVKRYPGASALLVDTFVPGEHGGTGRVFDWTLIPPRLAKPIILAGGLTPDNVADAIRQVQPYAVDVSTGVESEPGKKDWKKIEFFVRAVRSADADAPNRNL